jgi:hypothetical protein
MAYHDGWPANGVESALAGAGSIYNVMVGHPVIAVIGNETINFVRQL